MEKLDCDFIKAVREGNIKVVQDLLDKGCRVDVSDCQNLTPLHLAASRDHVDIVKLLLSHGAQVNRKTVDKLVPLHFAAVRGFIDTVKVLLNAGAHVDAIDSSEQTALHLVICRGHVDVAELLIQHGAKVNIEEIHGYTPLCEAVWQKSVPLVRLLLSSGAKITQSHYLLHYAVLHQHYEMVKLLLDAGSIPNLRDHETGDTPLILAAKTGQSHIADLLLKNGASPNYVNSLTGLTPLHVVVRIRESDFASVCTFIKVLCRHNVNLNATVSTSGETPLSMALINKRYRAAVLLIKLGADVNLNSKMVPNLAIAWNHNNFPIVRLLVAAGLDMRQRFPEINRPDDFNQLNTETITGWLKYRKFNPPPMADLCRICVRQYLGDKVSDVVPTLDLPKILQQYLMFEDIYVEDPIINTRISCGDSGLFSKYL
uniref:SOCS box domain-containing protein n=1 Tax=Clastoptera arizonana TaxID=38151 RepID=A0A1B6CVH5_9HEMI